VKAALPGDAGREPYFDDDEPTAIVHRGCGGKVVNGACIRCGAAGDPTKKEGPAVAVRAEETPRAATSAARGGATPRRRNRCWLCNRRGHNARTCSGGSVGLSL
jgi:hypothetical protein